MNVRFGAYTQCANNLTLLLMSCINTKDTDWENKCRQKGLAMAVVQDPDFFKVIKDLRALKQKNISVVGSPKKRSILDIIATSPQYPGRTVSLGWYVYLVLEEACEYFRQTQSTLRKHGMMFNPKKPIPSDPSLSNFHETINGFQDQLDQAIASYQA